VIPKPPSTRVDGPLSVTLRGDLDAICLKALRKDPAERYESAAALAGDLRHYLDGAPVRARAQTRRYRLSKFVRRNRLPVALAAAAAASLLLGTAVSMWQAAVAQSESELRLVEAERATAARDYLISWLTTFDPNRLEGQREFSVDEIVQVGFDNLGSLQAQPQVRAAVMNSLGTILFNFGRWGRADSVYRAAYESLRPRGAHPDLAVSMMGIGEVWRARTRFDSARTWFEEALQVRRVTLPPQDPRIAEAEEALAFVLYNLVAMYGPGPRRDSLLVRAYELRESVANNRDLPPMLRASALEGLGDIDAARGDRAAAVPSYREAYALRVEALGSVNPENGYLLWGLADALWETGELAEAEEAYRQALATLREVYREANPALATAHYNLAHFLRATGRVDEAVEAYRRSVAEWASTGEDDHVFAGWSWVGMGMALLEVDSVGAAEDALRRGLEIYEGSPDVRPRMVAGARDGLGVALMAQGRSDEALVELRAAREVLLRSDPPRAEELSRLIADLESASRGAVRVPR
jgi:serine/threonine-protein kinase